MLDSGIYSLLEARKRNKPIKPFVIKEYADFIEKHKDILYAWFNLEDPDDPIKSKENADYLRSRGSGDNLIEIWHPTWGIKELDKMVAKEPPVLAIGGTARLPEDERKCCLKEVIKRHPEQNFHLLGCANSLLLLHNWFSSDSTGWLIGRKSQKIITWSKGQLKIPHWDPLKCLAWNSKLFAQLERIR